MPEGDTLFKTAHTLRGVLLGQPVSGFRSTLGPVADAACRLRLVGQTIAAVEARGKHLLVTFSGGAMLHTHLGMPGSWHIYRHGTRWWRSPGAARAVIETPIAVAVCFAAPTVELLPPGGAERHPVLASLGPDLLDPAFDGAQAFARLRARGEDPIGVALVDQRALAGIGNVYKSEVLFLCGVSPFDRVADLDDATLARLVETARRQLRRNVGPGERRTRPSPGGESLWVYGRSGQRCLRCGDLVRIRRQGSLGRTTYYCARCQPSQTAPVVRRRPQ